jgi:cobalt-zinc-cadmium efflux system outer membrane protein
VKKHALATLFFALLMVSRAGAEDIPAPLTLDAALQRFRTRAFDLIIAEASIASATADVTVAGATPNPSLSLSRGSSSTYDPSLCAGCSNTSISAGLIDQAGISDRLSGKRRLRIDVANAALDATKRSRADVERTIEFTLKQQLLQAELGKQSVAYARDAQRLSTNTLALVDTRYKAGAVSEADVARAEVQELEAEQSVDVSAQTLAVAKAGLAYLLAYDRSTETLDVSDDLIRDVATTRVAVTSADDLLQRALASRPDLAAVRSQMLRARASIDLARRLRVPDLLSSIQYSQEGRGQNAIQPPTVTFGVSSTLPVFYRYSGEIARAEADLRTQETLQSKVMAQVQSDVASAFAAFSGARSRSERMRQLLARAGRARDLVRLQYEKGAASLFEFLDAQRTYLGVQSESLQTLNDYWTAVFQLEQAAGVELRQ